jgi:hypothetical protein
MTLATWDTVRGVGEDRVEIDVQRGEHLFQMIGANSQKSWPKFAPGADPTVPRGREPGATLAFRGITG